jgi:hypothetical protein
MRSTLVRVFAAGCLGLLLAAALVAGEPGDSRPIHDNSFLIEEALQIVPGIAFPFGVGPNRGERSVALYLSLEHPLWTPAHPLPPRWSG